MTTIAPQVLWAQRSSAEIPEKNVVFLTVKVTDPKGVKIDLQEDHLALETDSDYAADKATHYKLHIDFFKPIDVEASRYDAKSSGNHISFVLRKKEAQEEYWPRLTKEKAKYNYLKTDFDKWVDEDEQDEKEEEEDPQMAGGFPGAGGAGGPGGMDLSALMGGAGGAGGMDLSSLMGGAGGAGGMDFSSLMGGAGGAAPAAEDEEEGSSDGEEAKATETATK